MSGYAPSLYAQSVNSMRVKDKMNEGGNHSEDMTMAAMSQTNFSKTGMIHIRDNFIDREPSLNMP